MNVRCALVTVAMALSLSNSSNAADSAPKLPPILLPDIGLQRLPEMQTPSPAPQIEEAPGKRGAPRSSAAKFTLKQLQITGVTVFDNADLEPYFHNVVGRTTNLSEVQAAAREVERRYRDDGYFLARVVVPVQTVVDGSVKVIVLEGAISDVKMDGDVGPVASVIDSYLRPVTEERPIRLATLERALLLANDLPGIAVSGLLRPAPQELGAAELVVSATRKPFDGALVIDNFGDDFTGRWETAASVSSNSWTAFGERITVTGFTTEPWSEHSQQVGQVATSWQPGLDGLTFETIFSYGNSDPGASVQQFNFNSTTLLAGGTISYPVIRSRTLNFSTRMGFEYLNSNTDVFGGETFSDDKQRTVIIGASGDVRDGSRALTSLDVALRQGLPILNATRRSDEDKSTPNGTAQSTVIRLAASRAQPLYRSLGLAVMTGGQYSFSKLLSNEQFDLGGTSFGRGFDFNEVSGNSGVGATAELRYDIDVGLSYFERTQLFTFAEGGRVWGEGEGVDDHLASTGAGVRLFPIGNVAIELQVAKPLTRSQRANDTRDPQFLFRAVGRL